MNSSKASGLHTTLTALLAAALVASLIVGPVGATTPEEDVTFVESTITTDTTWTPEGGPYRIIQDIRVEPGATLTLEPGTRVQLAEQITLTVSGSLNATGTEARPVTISRSEGASPDRRWESIRYNGSDDSRFVVRNATLTGGVHGVTVASSAGSIKIVDSTMRDFETAAVSVGEIGATPEVTIHRSTFEDVEGHAISASPSFGATDRASLTAVPDERTEQSDHTLSLHPGVGVAFDTIRLEYSSADTVAGVERETLDRIGLDRNRNGTIDRSYIDYVQNVSTTGGDVRIALNRTFRIPSDGRLTVEYGGAVNPQTRGIYPVDVRLFHDGVSQLSDGVQAAYVVGGVTSPVRSSGSATTHVRRLTVRQSQFRDIAGTGLFVAADRVTRLRAVDNDVAQVGGDGIAVRAKDSESAFWYNDIAASADGIYVETLSRAKVTGYENHISGSETGIKIRQSGTRIRREANVTLRRNHLTDNDRHGIDVTTRTLEVRLHLANNTVRANGRDGIHLSNWIVRRGDILDNRIAANGDDGLALDGTLAADLRIARNDVRSSGGDGVTLRTQAAVRDLTVRNNTLVDGDGHGLAVQSNLLVHDVDIDENRLANNGGAGLLVSSPITHRGALTLTDNVVGANTYGIVVRGLVRTTIRDNDVVFNTNAFTDAVPLRGVTPGTGVYVTEGASGVVVNQANAEISLSDLVANPTLNQELTIARLWDDTVVVLRSDGESEARAAEASAVTIRRVGDSLPTGIAVPKTGTANETFRVVGNDVYGQRRGLTVDIAPLIAANTTARIVTEPVRTVHAESNYWGSDRGPYHSSILPEGEGNAVVTERGWADFVPFRTEPTGTRYARPTPRIDAPAGAIPDRRVRVSGGGSTSGTDRFPVDRYHFVVNGTERAAQSAPDWSLVMPTERLRIELAVEDALGIDSANATAVTVEPQSETTPTATSTAVGGTPSPTPSDVTLLGSLGSLWGLLGSLLYLSALLLGGVGMAYTFRNRSPPVGGLQVQGLAATGVLVWLVSGLLGPGPLVSVGLAAGLVWGLLTGVAYVLAVR
ncbi:right-handed parallel beta-helix repeat-containing protein [Halobellus sp. H-GB7]|uniref:right-handed parallel beta-helix repeat-containing protein n=1 Tax=Halobellus sp. H-GB7 TaxID=3069756 RepID=UPI0027B5EE15|nr:right-handed parallel beta-helix repeat-containing protein [Halobellus sp. H-GB7]MDQ2054479.1 right-handed parallel beta-helix repeat-containing protein [Halobellus sp. H-GB7]